MNLFMSIDMLNVKIAEMQRKEIIGRIKKGSINEPFLF
jgi:hypothetical protein